MLHVKTRVVASPIEGLGLFADEPIAAGTLVSKWQRGFDVLFYAHQLALLPPSAVAFLHRYGWDGPGETLRVSLDDSRYVNHSKTPNLVVDPSGDGTRAARDIAIGEELTEDYSSYDADFETYGQHYR